MEWKAWGREVLGTDPGDGNSGERLGESREGRPIRGFRFGSGTFRLSLLGGCHADEPTGPELLRRLTAYLGECEATHPLLTEYEWWIVPHGNPDGEERNRGWWERSRFSSRDGVDLVDYLSSVVREAPGDDIEFGFPRDREDLGARPENRAIADFWRRAPGPFDLHGTLHGIAFAAGPWFLVEGAWLDRLAGFQEACRTEVRSLGYSLHDVERHGEKGFVRIDEGFCTRPDSRSMARFFEERGDAETAALFRPSSMETMRDLGGDPLTLVSEMPLFLTPGVGEVLGPPDPAAELWQERIARWRLLLAGSETETESGAETETEQVRGQIESQAREAGLSPMPFDHQMVLQWAMIGSGIRAVRASRG